MNQINLNTACIYGAFFGVAYGMYNDRARVGAALSGMRADDLAYVGGGIIGGIMGGALLFGLVALIWNWAGRVRR